MVTVHLIWTNNVSGATALELHRSVGEGFSLYQTLALDAVAYIDNAPMLGVDNIYKIRAINGPLNLQTPFTANAVASVPAMIGSLTNLVATVV